MYDDEPVSSLLRRAQHELKIKLNHDKYNSNYFEVILTRMNFNRSVSYTCTVVYLCDLNLKTSSSNISLNCNHDN